ncbi:MAG: iron chelate uptake ABC transporter family permease subunit, partial [Pseudomonadota bacterium]
MTQLAESPTVDDIVATYRRRSFWRVALVVGAACALFTTVLIDVITGPADLSFFRVAHVIFQPSVATAKEEVIVWDLRLPVATMAVVVGAMLGVAGAEMQTILNNPLADPFTLGLSSAASFGAAVAIVLGWSVLPGIGALFVTVNAFA